MDFFKNEFFILFFKGSSSERNSKLNASNESPEKTNHENITIDFESPELIETSLETNQSQQEFKKSINERDKFFRSHSFKSALTPNARTNSKVLKIRRPFVFSESNLVDKVDSMPFQPPQTIAKSLNSKVNESDPKTGCMNATKDTTLLKPIPRVVADAPSKAVSSPPKVSHEVNIHLIRKKQAKIDLKRERKASKTVSNLICKCLITN